MSEMLEVVIVGASGDLAQKKIIPALFALFCQNLLPENFQVTGYARSEMTHDEFRNKVTLNLTCRYVPGSQNECSQRMDEFLQRCFYVQGQYDDPKGYLKLNTEGFNKNKETPNRIFYFSIPPTIFAQTAMAIGNSGLNKADSPDKWVRAVIEKPFGRDRESSDKLSAELASVFSEEDTYRIDHYLGKEVIQNLMVLRFANLIFEPIWNRNYIRDVNIIWQENLSVYGRGGYFDKSGIIRDVMQNHLLQILALVAMEQPVSLDSRDIRDEKVKALRSIKPVELNNLVVGQYTKGILKAKEYPGYKDDKTVPPNSITPTFAATILQLQNRRWDGVPFMLMAGKGMAERSTEIRIRFKEVPGNLFSDRMHSGMSSNELVIRVQPDEEIHFTVVNKVPGMGMELGTEKLDLRYTSAFSQEIPDAYECLIMDVVDGDKGLFIRNDELEAAWDIFTPVLHELEEKKIRPEIYSFGQKPKSADKLAAKYATTWE